MNIIFSKHKNLDEELNCPWGDKENAYLLKEDLSVQENLNKAIEYFPMLKKLVEENKFLPEEVQRYSQECLSFVFAENDEIWQLKEFFRHWYVDNYVTGKFS